MVGQFKRRLYEILEKGAAGDAASRFVDRVLMLLIVVNVTAVIVSTVGDIGETFGLVVLIIDIVSGVVFSLEYFARLWVADLHPPLRHYGGLKARLRYAVQPFALIDLIAVLPFWMPLLLGDFRAFLLFRLLRFLKLARYSPALRSLITALVSESRAILASAIIIGGVVLTAATILHLVESDTQPDAFGSIPAAIWWALATVTTVGYGDVVPVTVLGKVVGSVVMVLGYVLLALPVGIVATAFAREIHSREFVVTWGMVARVPLFEELGPADIADIAKLLHSQSSARGEIIARAGEPADSMYFIVSGTVEIDLPGERLEMHAGNFFGEMAVLKRANRSATVTAVTDCRLLVLDADGLHRMMRRRPEVAARIRDVVRQRLGKEELTPGGDMSSEELDEPGVDIERDT
ncbi:cyclic nucleotide-gated ion channel [Breoghania sp. L-A4]|uniref:cyclic nucleotide-gated ion channel n=1 Tax=Breoghania sp. L-A4 TaxID=2304600 RepID=UPI000E35F466|nr:cyclic nucleotide-gated ion channel [Breoghania sp. L-A4]AXS42655.1 cyclic nucleotide-binding protein [Breoghania sp. L-A4]